MFGLRYISLKPKRNVFARKKIKESERSRRKNLDVRLHALRGIDVRKKDAEGCLIGVTLDSPSTSEKHSSA
jgi:hypothetical protein